MLLAAPGATRPRTESVDAMSKPLTPERRQRLAHAWLAASHLLNWLERAGLSAEAETTRRIIADLDDEAGGFNVNDVREVGGLERLPSSRPPEDAL